MCYNFPVGCKISQLGVKLLTWVEKEIPMAISYYLDDVAK